MPPPPFPSPRLAARLELARAAIDLGVWTPRALWYAAVSHGRHERGVQADLAAEPVAPEEVSGPFHWTRPPRLFLSCAEASGAAHAKNLALALRQVAREEGLPEPEMVGLGDPELAAAGVRILADPVGDATLHAKGIAKALPFYVGLIRTAAESFSGDNPPDFFVPVDSPALHIPMARVARKKGVPTVHFIAPQFWGWAPWRVGRYRRNVALGLTILPFEPHWFRRHGVPVHHVGHPLLDELADIGPIPVPSDPKRTDWVILPGSRKGEIEDNLPWMLAALRPLRAAHPKLRMRIAQQMPDHKQRIEALVTELWDSGQGPAPELCIGDLHGVLATCKGGFAVSGTVLTDLLVHRIPAVVIYRDPGGWKSKVAGRMLTPGLFASTNLIAGRALLPEYVFGSEGPTREVSADLERMHSDLVWRAELLEGMDEAAQRLGPKGACERAARAILAAHTRAMTQKERP